MKTLSKRETILLQSMHLSAKANAAITRVWQTGHYYNQREYANLLLLLLPLFILFFLVTTTTGYPNLATLQHVMGGLVWVLYFAIPTFVVLWMCFKTLATHDRATLLGHSAMYFWKPPKTVKIIYTMVAGSLLILFLAKVGLIVTSICLALTFIVVWMSKLAIRRKVQRLLDEIERGNAEPKGACTA
jgi:hypothetical protein